jgi:hypothetical protein
MNTFEWRILTQLRENRGASFTAYQVANYDVNVSPRLSMGKTNGNSASVQLARKALDNLVTEGYVVKKSRREGRSRDNFYSAR